MRWLRSCCDGNGHAKWKKCSVRPSSGARRNFHTVRRILAKNADEFCKNTTLHGLKYVTNEGLHPTERIYFIISIIAVVIISTFYILKAYEKWSTTPLLIAINPEPNFITNEPFPAVTICNLNQALKSKAIAVKDFPMEKAMLKLLCKEDFTKADMANNDTNWHNLESLIINISQPCDKMMVSCRFAANEYDCVKHFFPIITDEGLCCVFNMIHPKFMYILHTPLSMRNISTGDFKPVDWYAEAGYGDELPNVKYTPRRVAGIGESLGLSITLDVQADKYYCSSTNSIGFKISLHSPNESPNVRETGVLIAPGYETKVRIHPEKTQTTRKLRTIHTKYRRCVFHDERKLRYFAHYTQRNCEMECIARMLVKHCGCISFYMPKVYRNESICGLSAMACVEKVRLRKDPSVGSCVDTCLPSCDDLTFCVDVFAIPLSHEGFYIENKRVQRYKQEYVDRNIAVINMYFKEYSFRSSIQTEFIGTADFLSSVGGLMGLFLGFSFISIVELIYYAVIHPIRKLLDVNYAKTVYQNRTLTNKLMVNDKTLQTRKRPAAGRYKRFRKYLQARRIYDSSSSRLTKQKFFLKSQYTRLNDDTLQSIAAALERRNEEMACS